jgi:hypothetical protein
MLSLPALADWDPRLLASAVVLAFGLLAYIGADFALRIQFFVLAALMAAIASFFLGGWDSMITPTLTPTFSERHNFWTIFALFFPAVTGITVGASMSGDLRDPSRSIPRGTLYSILFTFLVYISAAWWLSVQVPSEILRTDPLVMQSVARWPVLIFIGVGAATLSSALGSVLAAPRTLQALANDRIVPRLLGRRLGSATEPRAAVLVTTAIAITICWLGGLDFVAVIITMFFLNTYGMTNAAHAVESLVGNPSYRPRIRVHWSLALLGAAGCYGAMFLIDPLVTLVAIIVSYGLFFYLERRRLTRTWGDLRSGLWFALARHALMRLEEERWHVKNWRPNLIVFSGQPHNREQLADVADWLSQGQGLVTFFQLLVGDFDTLAKRDLRDTARRRMREYVRQRHMVAFPEADVVEDFLQGALTVSQAHGIGGLEPNSVLLGWSRTEEGLLTQLELLRRLILLRKSVFLLHHNQEHDFGARRTIDIWWRGRGSNADLMVLAAHIISRHRSWSGARIRLLRIIDSRSGHEQTLAHMSALLEQVRVDAKSVVVIKQHHDQPVADIMADHSSATDLTLIGLNVPTDKPGLDYVRDIDAVLKRLGTVLLIHGAEREDLLDIER